MYNIFFLKNDLRLLCETLFPTLHSLLRYASLPSLLPIPMWKGIRMICIWILSVLSLRTTNTILSKWVFGYIIHYVPNLSLHFGISLNIGDWFLNQFLKLLNVMLTLTLTVNLTYLKALYYTLYIRNEAIKILLTFHCEKPCIWITRNLIN